MALIHTPFLQALMLKAKDWYFGNGDVKNQDESTPRVASHQVQLTCNTAQLVTINP